MRPISSFLVGFFLSVAVMATTTTHDSQPVEVQAPPVVTNLETTGLPDTELTVCEVPEPKMAVDLDLERRASCWQCRKCNPNRIKACGSDGYCVSSTSAGCFGASYPYACYCQ